jgi:hypothetical protein
MSTTPLLAAVAVGVGFAAWSVPATPRAGGDAAVPVRLILDQSRYAPGAHGRVRVRIGEDGYLLVLYAQPDGHTQVAYPIDPGVSDRVPADTDIEIRGRGGREAFTVEDSSGTGTWYAAISNKPFRFDAAALHGHWDYRAIPRTENADKVESELTTFVQGLATGRFDYDIVTFVIDPRATPSSSAAEPAASSEPPPPEPSAGDWYPGPWTPPGPWWPGWPGPLWWGPGGDWPGPYYDRATPGAPTPNARPQSGATRPPPGTERADIHPRGDDAPSPHRGDDAPSSHHGDGSGGSGHGGRH